MLTRDGYRIFQEDGKLLQRRETQFNSTILAFFFFYGPIDNDRAPVRGKSFVMKFLTEIDNPKN